MEEHDKQKKEKPSDSFGAWAKHFFRPWLEDNDKAMEEQYQPTWDEIKDEFLEECGAKDSIELLTWLETNYEPPKKKIT